MPDYKVERGPFGGWLVREMSPGDSLFELVMYLILWALGLVLWLAVKVLDVATVPVTTPIRLLIQGADSVAGWRKILWLPIAVIEACIICGLIGYAIWYSLPE